MSDDPLDFGETLKAKSDQLNAANLIGASITVQITGATVNTDSDQPLKIKLSGGHMPWFPCKGMRRVLAEIAGTTSAKPWIGKWITLYRDGEVLWAGKKDGGIRLAAVDSTLLPKAREFSTRINKQATRIYKIEPLTAGRPEGKPTANLEAFLTEAGLTAEQVDAWRAAQGKPAVATLSDDQRAQLAGHLAGNAAKVEEIRAFKPASPVEIVEANQEPIDTSGEAPADEEGLSIDEMRAALREAAQTRAGLLLGAKKAANIEPRKALDAYTPEQVAVVYAGLPKL